jgi:hypothetical protein
MSSASTYTRLLTRITTQEPASLDLITGQFDPRIRAAGRDIFFEDLFPLPPQTPMKSPTFAAIGVQIDEKRVDLPSLAARLAALAIERDCEIVVMTTNDYSGLERFGFRTERISGNSEAERDACREQIRRFWNIEIVI